MVLTKRQILWIMAVVAIAAAVSPAQNKAPATPTGKTIFRDSDGNLISNNEFVDIRMANFHYPDATQTRVLIGQNGVVVVTGRNPEGIQLAVRAIKMVEEEAHTANLTQRIKVLLNVPDTPQEAPRASAPKQEGSPIDEVEEELEVEGEK